MNKHCIMFVTSSLDYGGAEVQLVRLATCLKARNWEVIVVSLTPPKAYVEELKQSGIPVHFLGIWLKLPDPCPVLRLARLVREYRPHIVHSFMVHANLFARLIRLIVPFPVLICSARSTIEGGRHREILYRITDSLCDLTTQVSREGLERYVKVGAVPTQKIWYIPNGVDMERFRPDASIRRRLREELGLNKAFVLLAVGRFVPPKDYPNMLLAFAQVTKKYPEARLFIAGDGPLRPAMQEFVRNLGIGGQVKFLGIRKDIPELMNIADGYVISSAWEGMPNVLLEAHAVGLPLVATAVGGNREVVLDGITGFLVPPRNPDALARAILQLMALPEEKRRRMGESARKHIEVNFSLDRVVEQWEALYRKFLFKNSSVL